MNIVSTSIVTVYTLDCPHGDGSIRVRVENGKVIEVKHLEPRV